MLKSHDKFHSANGKRLILIADDEPVNRELLGLILERDYEVLYAENGQEALELMRTHSDTLSLVLMDLIMPVMGGLDVLRQKKEEPAIQQIPVIVATSDQEAEIECLTLGAIDFIPKPYPQAGVILARIQRTIELIEDRQTINSTERDPLTGLYNREFFYRYAEQFDQHHKDLDMDAIVVDVNHFHMINERFGNAYGDEVLRRIGEKVREMVRDTGGIVCRREADTFMVYCPHGKDYRAILESASIGLTGDAGANNRVRLRMGVYENVDKTLDIERRFDRAKNAADTVRNSFTRNIGKYDSTLHERELYAEQLIEDFHGAIEEKQFKVYFQPKFNIRPEIPVLASAEALVRWQHPTLGLISPGIFIPLFEDNGLIQKLDNYVWRTAAAQIRDWKERFGFTVPVSVNVSRIDMYDPNLTETFLQILAENGLNPSEMLLEITESAYTQDSEQIIETVNQLRELGFRIEMDDFGTGYSSLNMISTLPIDALKLDMQFIRNAFNQRKDTRMLEVIIDIADYLSVPVIAEGVETAEQLNALKAMGCDLVQGYYFSRPVPAPEYERFILERREQMESAEESASPLGSRSLLNEENREKSLGRIAFALSSGFESVYYVDVENDNYVQFSSEGKYEDLQIERSGLNFFDDTFKNIQRVVYPQDVSRVLLSMQKETLLSQLVGGQPFTMTYRLLIEGKPTYYGLKAVRINTHDSHYIVIGVSNVDAQIREAGRAPAPNTLDFNSLAKALTSDMESIYYIDTETDTYMEFVAEGSYGSLKLEITGENFFDECEKNIGRVIFIDDREKVSAALEKGTLLNVLKKRQKFSMDYRLLIDGEPLYYRLKVIPADHAEECRHIIIGVSNIDAQITDDQRLEAERQSVTTYSRVAQALARDYFSIYYVDTETDRFIEYSAHADYDELGIEKSGEDFFNLSRRNMERISYPEDLANFLTVFTKENVLRELRENGIFTIGYRLNFNGTPTHVRMKATNLGDRHIVIGVNNVDAEMQSEAESLTYNKIAQALASDLFTIYYVDMDTDAYIEYSASEEYRALGLAESGEDFFAASAVDAEKYVYEEDREAWLQAFRKDRMEAELARNGTFTMKYRLLLGGQPTWVSMKATRIKDSRSNHVVIGVSSIDAQIRREEELNTARFLANRDALTGVKSKHAFVEAEQKWNRELHSSTAPEFAVVICDVNDLKQVNDTQGHKAGDTLICSASAIICRTFTHSPVFRIGGDEFTVILSGSDFENRESLMAAFREGNRRRSEEGGVVIASGIAEFAGDPSFETVFERADAAMYENKKTLKAAQAG